jgi:hypothetical protein
MCVGAAFSFITVFTATSGVESTDFVSRFVSGFVTGLSDCGGPPRTAGGLAWGFTTPKGPGRPRTGLDCRSRSRRRSDSDSWISSARTWPLDPRPWQSSRSRSSSDSFVRYSDRTLTVLVSDTSETRRTDREEVDAVSAIIGAAVRTEAVVARDTLADVSIVALVH